MIDALARHAHYLDHIAPIWHALPDELRGTLWVDASLRRDAQHLGLTSTTTRPSRASTPTLVAGWPDARRARHLDRPVILMEHGAGQTYIDTAVDNYAGGADRQGVVAVLVPNEYSARAHRAAHPEIPATVIGCPKLDAWVARPPTSSTTICISFHWDAHRVAPEARTAWPAFRRAIPALVETHPGTIGHAHPRIAETIRRPMAKLGLEFVASFAEVVDRAGLYICDNSSTLFEFAALDRPVVVLNAPGYRRHVHHGGRFWDWADIGPQVNAASELVDVVDQALLEKPDQIDRRRRIVADVYPHLGHATSRAVDALQEVSREPARLR